MSNEHNKAHAVPQGEPVGVVYSFPSGDGNTAWGFKPNDSAWEVEKQPKSYERRFNVYLQAAPATPSQERCCTCGYLTSEREHLGCLRKAVKDLDAATGGPYPSQPVNRPQNCGTSFCSCIECVCEPELVTLTEEVLEPIVKVIFDSGWSACRDSELVGDNAKEFAWDMSGDEITERTSRAIIAALREKGQAK